MCFRQFIPQKTSNEGMNVIHKKKIKKKGNEKVWRSSSCQMNNTHHPFIFPSQNKRNHIKFATWLFISKFL